MKIKVYMHQKKIRNGMNKEEIYKSYQGYEIKKMKSEGAGDSQDDYTYTVTDNFQKNNILFFDVVYGEIQGMHAGKKDLIYLIVSNSVDA